MCILKKKLKKKEKREREYNFSSTILWINDGI